MLLLTFSTLLICLTRSLCLAAAAFYCDTSGRDRIPDKEFSIRTTKEDSRIHYESDTFCKFETKGSGYFFVDFETAQTTTARLIVKIDNAVVFEGDSGVVKPNSRSRLWGSGRLSVTFNSSGDNSQKMGFKLKVSRLPVSECPLGWTRFNGVCIGSTSVIGSERLSYPDAQVACNNMGSNLLHAPTSDANDLRRFAPSYGKAWIGLNDLMEKQFDLRWLNGSRLDEVDNVECNGTPYNAKGCNGKSRCGAVQKSDRNRAIVMDRCDYKNKFLCSTESLNNSKFYELPDFNYDSGGHGNLIWLWILLGSFGGIFALLLLTVVIRKIAKENQERVNRAIENGEIGIVALVVETGNHQQQQQQQQLPPSYDQAAAETNSENNGTANE